jgi:hypothetical protein
LVIRSGMASLVKSPAATSAAFVLAAKLLESKS